MKSCYGKSIRFGDMYMLIYGQTWYLTYGFIPYDSNNRQIDTYSLNIAKKNKYIIRNTKINQIVNLKKYIYKYEKNEYEINRIIKIIDDMQNQNISEFFKMLLSKYDETSCSLFYNIYLKIMADLNIVSMHGKSYYMKL